MAEEKNPPLINVANVLTVTRLVLVPFFIWALWEPSPGRRWLALVIFCAAALTDKLDGHLARSRGLITDFGKLADSIADKALIISALLLLSANGWLWWWVTIVFIVRELGITALRMVMKSKKVMAAGRGGKIKMAAQVFGVAGVIVPWSSFLSAPATTILFAISYAGLGIALFFALTSAYEYIREALRISQEAQ